MSKYKKLRTGREWKRRRKHLCRMWGLPGLCTWACSRPVILLLGMASGSMTTDKHLDLLTIGR